MTVKQIEQLIELGCKRWQKNAMDRLYVGEALQSKLIGFDSSVYDRHLNRKISHLHGERISNNKAFYIRANILRNKMYIDVVTGEVKCSEKNDVNMEIVDALNEMLQEA